MDGGPADIWLAGDANAPPHLISRDCCGVALHFCKIRKFRVELCQSGLVDWPRTQTKARRELGQVLGGKIAVGLFGRVAAARGSVDSQFGLFLAMLLSSCFSAPLPKLAPILDDGCPASAGFRAAVNVALLSSVVPLWRHLGSSKRAKSSSEVMDVRLLRVVAFGGRGVSCEESARLRVGSSGHCWWLTRAGRPRSHRPPRSQGVDGHHVH